ncbi:hypothetical protein K437DRAFT_124299 [Tilletiaria anomala UBC 951]|uniref:Uncharacterized protein n=1 Tax=Tilletiaria anomala (strain ATCC 24038 / CBS 436.72 / UBC 951) TaxID=1037660 RepID=A0A066VY79_TILAU|nr:uncharacterized protein K437DRAFT_124299 [Tilletiaria anomala UBC 951]KDN45243.1 hypothetical protein K437DRAFT_124299 [Tilletiaria anomala UBC 951]
MSTFGRQGAIESARKGDWSAAATASSKSMDDLALLLASQRGIVSPLRQQPLRMVPASTVPPAAHAPSARHGLDFDDIRKSVFKSWGIQSASDPSKLQATATSRAGSYTGGLHPLKMFLPIPLASGLPGGPKRLRKLKVSFIPFASESSMQTPETTVKPSHTSMGSRSSQSSAKLTPHLAGNEFAAMPRSPASPRRGGSRWPHEVCRVPSRSVNIDAFRINAQVLLPPGETSCKDGSLTDDGLPEPMSFPVVLAVCDSQRNLELFPEGWAALGLGGGPIEAEAKPEELATNPKFESVHPMLGVTDLIIAGCAAIMDL